MNVFGQGGHKKNPYHTHTFTVAFTPPTHTIHNIPFVFGQFSGFGSSCPLPPPFFSVLLRGINVWWLVVWFVPLPLTTPHLPHPHRWAGQTLRPHLFTLPHSSPLTTPYLDLHHPHTCDWGQGLDGWRTTVFPHPHTHTLIPR